MSSAGSTATSTSSKIRQFGLYRSIDARTEEFLKLSRKRQLRQGCACAVISTLITVTVVVSVLLMYEYGVKSTWRPSNNKRSGWFGLINGTDPIAFKEKIAKSNNFERTTLKLLPIVLKALKQNGYLEKIIDDYASSSSKNEIKSATEFTFKRNVFSDLNSMKPPSSRLYAIAYKNPPMSFTRNVTRNQHYYSKLRKMSNYKRITNYIDKMISEKVGTIHNQPLNYENYYKRTEKNTTKFHKPSINQNENRIVNKLNIHKVNQTIQKHLKQSKQSNKNSMLKTNIRTNYSLFNKQTAKKHKNVNFCTCLSKISHLLKKLQVNVQQLISDTSDQLLQPCNFSPKNKTVPNGGPVIIISTSTSKASLKMTKTNINNTIFESNIPYLNHYIYNQPKRRKAEMFNKDLVNQSKTDTTIKKSLLSELPNTSSALKPNIQSVSQTFNFTTTSMPQVFASLIMVHHKPTRERKIYSSTTHKLDSVTTRNYIQLTEFKEHSKKTIHRNFITLPIKKSELKNSQHMAWPLFKPNLNYKNTMKTNIISKTTIPPLIENTSSYNEKNITMTYLKDNIESLKESEASLPKSNVIGSLQSSYKLMDAINDKRSNDSTVIETQNTTSNPAKMIESTTTITLEENILFHTNIERTSETTDITTLEPDSSIPKLYNSLHYEDRALEDYNPKNTPDGDFYDDITSMPTSNVTKITQSFSFEGDNGIQSMLPQNRPTYLKIQRSDWKPIQIFRLDSDR